MRVHMAVTGIFRPNESEFQALLNRNSLNENPNKVRNKAGEIASQDE
jgi:hypothetical protein